MPQVSQMERHLLNLSQRRPLTNTELTMLRNEQVMRRELRIVARAQTMADNRARRREEVPKKSNMISKTAGKIITSLRTFGVEYEVNLSWNVSDRLREMITAAYNVVHDGSVRDGLEVVSPILGGKKGEEEVDKVCAKLAELNAGADDSCGLHVHIGASDFFQRSRSEIWTLEHVLKFITENPKTQKEFLILHESVIKNIKKQLPQIHQAIIYCEPIGFFNTEKLTESLSSVPSNRCVFTSDQDIRLKMSSNYGKKKLGKLNTSTVSTEDDLRKLVAAYKGAPVSCNLLNSIVIDSKYSANMRVLVRDDQSSSTTNLTRLKRLAAFYVTFDDIIASMLPSDRRANDYARRAVHRMSLEAIRECSTVTQFLKTWMNFSSEESIQEARPDARPRARYCGLNLYALLKQSTIEIRYLGGTIDAQLIKHWIALHHAIVDLSADVDIVRGSVDSIAKASLIIDLGKKTDIFFKKLRLGYETEEYIRSLIDRFRTDDDVLFQECLDDEREDNLAPTVPQGATVTFNSSHTITGHTLIDTPLIWQDRASWDIAPAVAMSAENIEAEIDIMRQANGQ